MAAPLRRRTAASVAHDARRRAQRRGGGRHWTSSSWAATAVTSAPRRSTPTVLLGVSRRCTTWSGGPTSPSGRSSTPMQTIRRSTATRGTSSQSRPRRAGPWTDEGGGRLLRAHAARAGGVFTFQRSLVDAITAIEPDSRHEFLFYSAGVPSGDPRVIQIPVTRRAKLEKQAIDVVRAVQDSLYARAFQVAHIDGALGSTSMKETWCVGARPTTWRTPNARSSSPCSTLPIWRSPSFPQVEGARGVAAAPALLQPQPPAGGGRDRSQRGRQVPAGAPLPGGGGAHHVPCPSDARVCAVRVDAGRR